jgi:hypothetical protein
MSVGHHFIFFRKVRAPLNWIGCCNVHVLNWVDGPVSSPSPPPHVHETSSRCVRDESILRYWSECTEYSILRYIEWKGRFFFL